MPAPPKPLAMTVGSTFQLSLVVCWTHFGYGSTLKPKGFGGGLRADFAIGDQVDFFLEARSSRGLAEEDANVGYIEMVFDALTAVIGLSILLPGSELSTDTGEAEAVFFHQIEFGVGTQSFDADEELYVASVMVRKTELDESGQLALMRYRLGAQLSPSMYLSFVGGAEVVLRDQIGHNNFPSPPITEYEEAWNVDVTVTVYLSFNM
jgi:hypothetical protein